MRILKIGWLLLFLCNGLATVSSAGLNFKFIQNNMFFFKIKSIFMKIYRYPYIKLTATPLKAHRLGKRRSRPPPFLFEDLKRKEKINYSFGEWGVFLMVGCRYFRQKNLS